eukprot:TRINITY_DN6029_c0_g1_i1.p1 TRINITY_DN6029_c0_g1~~TRINITY_DN6029_c0_g1_i1.p1  ORF type:complete len:709 (+),score=96.97 TRINITY_DN6029_c0_g1_i1:82-2208(+)
MPGCSNEAAGSKEPQTCVKHGVDEFTRSLETVFQAYQDNMTQCVVTVMTKQDQKLERILSNQETFSSWLKELVMVNRPSDPSSSCFGLERVPSQKRLAVPSDKSMKVFDDDGSPRSSFATQARQKITCSTARKPMTKSEPVDLEPKQCKEPKQSGEQKSDEISTGEVSPVRNCRSLTSMKSTMTFKEEDTRRKHDAEAAGRQSAQSIDQQIVLRSTSRWLSDSVTVWVRSPCFDCSVAVAIMMNALTMGFEVELEARRPTDSLTEWEESYRFAKLIQHFFTVFFIIEFMLRIYGAGLVPFITWHSPDFSWNMFDCSVVTISLAQGLLEIFVASSAMKNISLIRMVRFMRVVRIVRIVRIMRCFRSLRILISSIFATLKALVWAMVLLSVIVYVFAIIFAAAVIHHLQDLPASVLESPPSDVVILQNYLGNTPRAIFTLFKSITGGMDWEIVAESLRRVSAGYVFLFIFFIMFGMLAVLNVVTGVFCQGALESAQQDQEEVIESQLSALTEHKERLKKLFWDIDEGSSGTITLSAFENYMRDNRIQAYFRSLDLHINEVWSLFRLIDVDGTNELDIDEFVDGCLRIRGPAKSLEVHELMYQIAWLMDTVVHLVASVEEHLEQSSSRRGTFFGRQRSDPASPRAMAQTARSPFHGFRGSGGTIASTTSAPSVVVEETSPFQMFDTDEARFPIPLSLPIPPAGWKSTQYAV